ncbi:YhgE/Pip family protein [Lacticaseibacillus porcinae]|uniref:YhgE/Pip family protein n=1 Tax=Lacticaseibacillus porcinae TaxID=1123687 RepID=UPI000F7AFF09|nr:YhgE/Pip domain-containing protein [Lacticaseibacillus porcinae]
MTKGVDKQVIKRELKLITAHKGLMWAMIAVILIPFFYSFCFLTSAWDPYGNTGKIPVAVVNLDQPATLEGKKIQAGADTVAQLHDDSQLEWHFVSAAKAAQGLKNNKFYTVVTIPKDFSKDAATVLDANPKQMKLTYETNGSLNYVSEIISQVGVDRLNSKIKEKLTTAFSTELFNKIGEIGGKLKTAADGAKQLDDGLIKYTNGVKQADDGVTQINDSVPQLSSGVQQLADGGNKLYTGVGQLQAKVPELSSGVSQLTLGGQQLNAGLGDLNAQVPVLSDGIIKLTAGGVKLTNGLGDLQLQVPTLADGVSKLTVGSGQVTAGLGDLQLKLPTLKDGVVKLVAGSAELNDGLEKLDLQMPALSDGVSQLADGGAQLKDGLGKLQAQVPDLADGVSQLNDGVNQYVDGSDQITSGISVLYSKSIADKTQNLMQLADGLKTLNGNVPALSQGVSDLYNGAVAINAQVNGNTDDTDLVKSVNALSTGMDQLYRAVTTKSTDANGTQYPAMQDGVQQLVDGLENLQKATVTGSPNLPTATSQLSAAMSKLHNTVSSQIDMFHKFYSADKYPATSSMFGAGSGFMKEATAVKNDVNDANNQMEAAIDKVSDPDQQQALKEAFEKQTKASTAASTKLTTAMMVLNTVDYNLTTTDREDNTNAATGVADPKGLLTAVSEFDTNLKTLSGSLNDPQAIPGMSQKLTYSQSIAQLVAGIKHLNDNIPALVSGAKQLDDGLASLNTKAPQLSSGVTQLTDGLGQLNGQVPTLSSGVSDLYEGSKTIYNGTTDPTGVDQNEYTLTQALTALNNGGQKLSANSTALKTGVSQLNASVPTLTAGVHDLYDGADQESTGLDNLKSQVPALVSGVSQLHTGSTQLYDGLVEFNGNVPALISGVDQLYSGSGQVSDGLTQLNGKVPALVSGVNQLYSGSTELSSGLIKLNGNTPALVSGVGQLYTGSAQLSTGLTQLNGNVPALASGVSQLYSGSGQLRTGLNELNSKVPALSSGVKQLKDGTGQLVANNHQLTDGSNQLSTGLTDGYQQVAATKLTKLTAKMFASPSKDVQKKYTHVKNYGAALAPYVLALAMFVAIIIFNFAYPMKRNDDDDASLISWLGGKVLVGTMVAIVAALVEATLMLVIGLPVAHIFGFYAMTILFALSAMYLTQVLNLAFSRVGIFIALGLLTLSGSGGLFPAQTISPLYESTQKFLPMTYAINGYRDAISGGIASGTVVSSIFVLVIVALLSLALMIPAVGLQSNWNHASEKE